MKKTEEDKRVLQTHFMQHEVVVQEGFSSTQKQQIALGFHPSILTVSRMCINSEGIGQRPV